MLYKQVRMMFMVAETPLHPGSGAETGLVDLPIQRERHTGFPKIEASTIKGCLRDLFSRTQRNQKIEGTAQDNSGQQRKANGDLVEVLFGPDTQKADEHAGALVFTDARILLFPVRSLKGVFAWVTCPMVLHRLKRECEIALNAKEVDAGEEQKGQTEIDSRLRNLNHAAGEFLKTHPRLEQHQAVALAADVAIESKIVLEQLVFTTVDNNIKQLGDALADIIFDGQQYATMKEKFLRSLVVIDDDSFGYLVRHATDVVTRVRINDETGTVVSGGLWTEEYLPQETVLWCLVMASDALWAEKNDLKSAAGIMSAFCNCINNTNRVFLGGDQTVGKGLVRLCVVGGNDHDADR